MPGVIIKKETRVEDAANEFMAIKEQGVNEAADETAQCPPTVQINIDNVYINKGNMWDKKEAAKLLKLNAHGCEIEDTSSESSSDDEISESSTSNKDSNSDSSTSECSSHRSSSASESSDGSHDNSDDSYWSDCCPSSCLTDSSASE